MNKVGTLTGENVEIIYGYIPNFKDYVRVSKGVGMISMDVWNKRAKKWEFMQFYTETEYLVIIKPMIKRFEIIEGNKKKTDLSQYEGEDWGG